MGIYRSGQIRLPAAVNHLPQRASQWLPATELPWRAKTVPATEANYAMLRKFISVVVNNIVGAYHHLVPTGMGNKT